MRRLLTLLTIGMFLGGMLAVAVRRPVPEPPRPPADATLDPDVSRLIDRTIAEVEEAPAAPLPRMKLGLVYEANALYPAARASYLHALEIEPGSPQCWYHLGLVQAQLGEIDDAISSVKQSGRLASDYAPSRWRIGYWQLERGRVDDAAIWFERALAIDGDDAAASLGLARARMQHGDDAGAARILEPWSVRSGPNAAYARFLLDGVHRRLGRDTPTVGADPHGVRPVWNDPWQDETRHFRPAFGSRLLKAVELCAAGRFDEAIAALEKLRADRPTDVTTLVNLGVAYHGVTRYGDALRVLEVAADAHPDHFAPQLNLAAVHLALGDAGRALAHADRAVALNRHLPAAHEMRGRVLDALDRYEDARAAFDECRRLDPRREIARVP